MGYYDIPEGMEEAALENMNIDVLFYVKDLAQRKLFLNTIIAPETVEDAVRHILQFNKEDELIPPENRVPIKLYITSDGGDVDAGFMLIDTIANSKTPVHTINLGWQYSMGFLIGLAGHKRYASKNAKFLMHDGSTVAANSTMKIQDYMKFQNKMEDRIKSFVISHSKIDEEMFDSQRRIEWYMYADEAKEFGFTDYIIGEDCQIEEVV